MKTVLDYDEFMEGVPVKTFLPQNQFVSNSDAHVPVALESAAVSSTPPLQTAAERIAAQFDWREFTEFVMDERVALLSDDVPLFLRDTA